MNERIIEERLERISKMLESTSEFTSNFLENIDIVIPDKAQKAIINIIESKEIKGIVEDIKTRRPPRIVLMGRSGVGKSSLINAMFGSYLAETSAVEVGTMEHEFFQYKKNEKVIFEIIDTRGIKENISSTSNSAEDDLNTVIEDFQPDAFLFLTNGADRSTLKKDAEDLKVIFKNMTSKPPLITIITRMDELEPSRYKNPLEYPVRKKKNFKVKEEQVRNILNNVGLSETFVIPVSAYIEWSHEDPESLTEEEREELKIEFDGRYNIDEIFDVLEDNIDFNVAMDLMFNHRIDSAVEKIAETFVKRFSAASSAIGATPIPVADILILLPIQIVEVMLIGYLSGNKIDAKSAREFIVSLGAVFLFGYGLRFVAQQGTKLLNVLPGAGSAISAGVAYSGTYSIGKAAIAYYIKGKSLEEAKQEMEENNMQETERNFVVESDEPEEESINEEHIKEEKKKKGWKRVRLNKSVAKNTWNKIRIPKKKK